MRIPILAVLTLFIMGHSFAQQERSLNSEEARFYRLNFAVKEIDGGKVISTRNYEIVASTLPQKSNLPNSQSIRSGDRVPVQSTSGNFTYMEVGVNIDCQNLREIGNQLALRVSSDISTLGDSGHTTNPLIRQTKWSTDVVVNLRKPTIISFADDSASKQQLQLELTATPVTPASR